MSDATRDTYRCEAHWDLLPEELSLRILQSLDVQSKLRAEQVSRSWRQLLHTPQVWRRWLKNVLRYSCIACRPTRYSLDEFRTLH